MPPNFTLTITSPEGDRLWAGPFSDFAEVNEASPELLTAARGLAPGERLIAGICWFGEEGIAPSCSTITRES